MSDRTFALLMAGLCLFFAVVETAYVLRLPLVMDEFAGARAVDRLNEGLPYRDFKPYKTVVGYYLQLPALSLPGSSWQRLINVKLWMVAINTAALLFASIALAKRFDRRAVIAGLTLLVTMSTFLERAPDLRVDTLTGLAGLGSLLLLIGRRHAWAGFLCGLSFLISQKGVYYALAANVALLGWFVVSHRRADLRSAISFNAVAALVVAIYFGLWSALAGAEAVFASVVGDAGRVVLDTIEDIRLRYWGQTVARNPLFYGLALAALWHLDRRRSRGEATRLDRLLLLYGATLVIAAVLHRQPWPYFFVLVIPTLWVLIVALIDARLDGISRLEPRRRRWLVAGAVVLGLVYPLSRLPVNLARDSGFQRHMIELAEAALEPGETYVAGVDLLWNRRQADPAIAWLDRLQLARLAAMPPGEQDRLIERLGAAPIKLVIDNYRIQRLPKRLRDALGRRFAFFWGNLLLYAPIVEPGSQSFHISVGGQFRVLSQGAAEEIDGRPVATGDTVQLEPGFHRRSGADRIRLQLLLPELERIRDPRYEGRRPLFPEVYDY